MPDKSGPDKSGPDTPDLHEIEKFLYHEARLIDDRKFDDWLSLFTDDAVYWVPTNRYDTDPTKHVSFIYDNKTRISDRIWRIQSGMAHAQDPASRTRHMISNVEITDASGDEIEVSSYLALFELRRGVQHTLPGRVQHKLRRNNGSWQIALRKVELMANDSSIDNLTFIV